MCTLLIYSSSNSNGIRQKKRKEKKRKICSLEKKEKEKQHIYQLDYQSVRPNGTGQTDQSLASMVYNYCCINSFNFDLLWNKTMLF